MAKKKDKFSGIGRAFKSVKRKVKAKNKPFVSNK